MRSRIWPALIVLLACVCVARAEGENRYGYGVSFAVGVDSNPLRVADDGRNGAFTQLLVDGSYTRVLRPTVALFASGNARARWHATGTANADYQGANGRFGFGLSPRKWAGGRFAVAAGGILATNRSTFVDRETGETYEVATGTGSPVFVPIGERFNFDSRGAFLNLRWNQNRRVRLFLDGVWERSDYTTDYSAEAGLSPLDFRSLTIEPGVNLTINRALTIGISVAMTDMDYDARPALDASGNEMTDITREYRFLRLRTTFMVTPAPRWYLRVGLHADDRSDVYAGYYDFGSWSAFASIERELDRRSRLRFYGSWSDLQYERATVDVDLEQLRGTDARTLTARYERNVARGLTWFADVGAQGTDSIDPIFSYDRNWVLSGVQFRR